MFNSFTIAADFTPTGVIATFYGPEAEARATDYRDANHPGFGVYPSRVEEIEIATTTTITLP